MDNLLKLCETALPFFGKFMLIWVYMADSFRKLSMRLYVLTALLVSGFICSNFDPNQDLPGKKILKFDSDHSAELSESDAADLGIELEFNFTPLQYFVFRSFPIAELNSVVFNIGTPHRSVSLPRMKTGPPSVMAVC